MALNEALNDMHRYAARGRVGDGERLPPGLQLEVANRIVRGDTAFISWRVVRACEVKIIIASHDFPSVEMCVPARGRRKLPRDLPVGRHIIALRAKATWPRGNGAITETRVVVEVVHPPPIVEITAPRRAVFGEPLLISWRILDAHLAEIVMADRRQVIDLEGAMELQPARCGAFQVTLHAVGPGGHFDKCIDINVVAPPVVISVPVEVSAEFGESIAIRYQAMGAATLFLKTLDRGDFARQVPLAGYIEIDDVTEADRLLLTATGHDGCERSQLVAVRIVPPAMTTIDDFLEILNGKF